MARQLTLGEFVKQLAVRMDDEHLAMLFDDETPWHMLFYRLSREGNRPGRPQFLSNLEFDWDAPTPKCQALSDYLGALHVSGSIGVVNPSFERIDIDPEMKDIWKTAGQRLENDATSFLEHAVGVAKEQFPKAAAS